MYLTLYKRCILSKDYTEVFDCTDRVQSNTHYSFFTQYLDTLTKTEYEIENVFITNEGSFNVPLEIANQDNIYEYNYMRLSYVNSNEQLYKTTRYCFINNIEIRNDIAIIHYTTDVWHSFSAFMEMRRSYLSRSRLTNMLTTGGVRLELSPYNLPVKYDGVNPLVVTSLFKNQSQNSTYNVILELQKYTTTTEGNESKRNVEYVMIQKRQGQVNPSSSTGWDINYQIDLSMGEVIDIIDKLTEKQGAKNLKSFYKYGDGEMDFSPVEAFYNIGNIYVVPSEYNLNLVFDNTELGLAQAGVDYIKLYEEGQQIISKYIYCLFCKAKSIAKYKDTLIKSQTITNDFKNIYIGHLTEQYDIVSNGLSRIVTLFSFVSEYDFRLLLHIDNKVIDITENYYVEVPFTSIDGNENSQRKMARKLGNIQDSMKLVSDVISLVSGGIFGGNSKNKINKINNQLSSALGIVSSITSLIEANAPLYSSTKGTFSITAGLLNAYYGVCLFKIEPSNETYVNKAINETGYITYYIGQHNYLKLALSTINTLSNKPYNVVKCDFIDLYGDFPQIIVENLKNILLNGTKIWYSSNPTQY